MNEIMRIGTRKSKLALEQTNIIIKNLKKIEPKLKYEIIPINTVGDQILNKPLLEFGGKGVFVDVFENALIEKKIDIAIHSAKDMPIVIPTELDIIAVSKREDESDMLITNANFPKSEIKKIGTSSMRRTVQVEMMMDVTCSSDIRGNVETRLSKLKNGEYDAIILATAGLKRLNLLGNSDFDFHKFSKDEFIPAAGQGIIAVEARKDCNFNELLISMNDLNTYICLQTERLVLKILNAGCHEAIGIHTKIEANKIKLRGFFYKNGVLKRVDEESTLDKWHELAYLAAEKLT